MRTTGEDERLVAELLPVLGVRTRGEVVRLALRALRRELVRRRQMPATPVASASSSSPTALAANG